MKYLSLFLKTLVTIPFVAYLLWLTIANCGQTFDFHWNPLTDRAASISLPLVMFLCAVFGFIWGSFILWANLWPLRAENRRNRKLIAALEKDLQREILQNNQLRKEIAVPVIDVAPLHSIGSRNTNEIS